MILLNRGQQVASKKPLLRMMIAAFVGLYIGVNLSGIYQPLPGTERHITDGPKDFHEKLHSAESKIDQWKVRAEQLEQEINAARNELEALKSQNCETEKSAEAQLSSMASTEIPDAHPICRQLPYPTPTASALWAQHIPSILQATRLPNDKHFQFHDFTAQLLQIVTPRLHRSVKSTPHDWGSLERAMTIAWERYQYMQLPTEQRGKIGTPPRPLKILIMGGSLLVGTNCRRLMKDLGINFGLPNRDCTWCNRVMQFLNFFFDNEMVTVTKIAMGGTNTATGNVIWQYDLIPKEARNPDIVVNAYSTNDMHILTVLEAEKSNTTLRDKVFETVQQFVRNIMYNCNTNQPPPLVLHMDDYLGNEQRTIWETTELSQVVQVLANYYGFTSISYSDMIRDFVYGDTRESWFSADWWETGSFERQIHPGMGMHISATWVVSYSLLYLVTTYCSLPPAPTGYTIHEYQPGYLGLPPLEGKVKQAAGKPHPHPKGLPPILTKDLLIEEISDRWRDHDANTAECNGETDVQFAVKCPFSWVSGLSLQQNNQTWIQEYFQRRATTWEGWTLGNDGGKLGFTPELVRNNHTEMILEYQFRQPIRSVTLFYMKSYGRKWKGSRLEIRLSRKSSTNATLIQEVLVSGIHDKETSEMYTESLMPEKPIEAGSKLRIEARLVGGSMFKIMGLAICS